jgi:hypothetical protein
VTRSEAWEDIGYRVEKMDKTYKLHKSSDAERIKIEYIRGFEKGKVRWLRVDIAQDLISRGYAKEVK